VTDILDLIDSAVHDWETSGDAMRWNPNAPTPMKETFTQIRFDTRPAGSGVRVDTQWHPQPVSLRMLGFAAEFERQMAALSQDERDEFVAYWQAGPWNFEQAFYAWKMRRVLESTCITLTASSEQFAAAMGRLGEPLRAFGLAIAAPPKHPDPCFCHPASFPAARDYRRRTKHRNRRRKH